MDIHSVHKENCQICHQEKPLDQLLPGSLVSGGVLNIIKKDHKDWDPDGYICYSCLNHFRADYVQDMMEKDLGKLDSIEKEVVDSIENNLLLSENLNEEYEKQLTFSDRIADKVADFGGSWKFIIWSVVILSIWIISNTVVLLWKPFDPYPFILLNLVLSMLAALQAPIIMMSQNRQEERDRMRAENDYQVNLKAEMEIRALTEKMDLLLHNEIRRFMEVQKIQMDMLNELRENER